jgi:hypothetical protein
MRFNGLCVWDDSRVAGPRVLLTFVCAVCVSLSVSVACLSLLSLPPMARSPRLSWDCGGGWRGGVHLLLALLLLCCVPFRAGLLWLLCPFYPPPPSLPSLSPFPLSFPPCLCARWGGWLGGGGGGGGE